MKPDPQPKPTDPHAERFIGIARLYGEAALARFRQASVTVVGIGGVGSWVAEALARSGIGTLSLVDLDDICLTNTNRQIHAIEGTIGKPKISVMAQRLKAINPGIEVRERGLFYTESAAEAFFAEPCSFIVDAIDSVRQKAHLLAECRRRGIPVVTVGGAGGRIDASQIKVADLSRTRGDRLLMLVRKKLRTDYRFPREGKGKFRIQAVYSDEVPRLPHTGEAACAATGPGINCDTGLGSATHVTASMGLFAAGLVLEQLAAQ
jgi:tRNA A37 threonylcarbamoyladenosine dehydratase